MRLKQRRVLQLIDSFQIGGSEAQAVQLVRLLHGRPGYQVYVACLNSFGIMREEVEGLLGEIPAFPLTSFYDSNMLKQLYRFARFLHQSEIDIVHTHDFYTNVFGMIGATVARVPARIASRRETDGYRTSAQQRVERGVYRLAHAVVANADAVRRRLIEEGGEVGKITTIHNGLDLERVKPLQSREETLTSFNLPRAGNLRFVTIVANTDHPVKDHPMFLRAAQLVRRAMPEARFILAGEGKLTDKFRALAAQLGLAGDVFFTGRCERVAEILAVSEVCALSSKAEGFSNSILEYMAASKPAVVTDVGGAREAITDGETGFLVPPGDHEAMADRIVRLLREPDRMREMGRRARRVVEQKFSCKARLLRTERLYDRLLARAAVPVPERVEATLRGKE